LGRVLKNQFAWSWTRHGNFESCLRKYWLSHYGFWGGWEGSASPDTREVYIQKKLLSGPQWLGIQVHLAAEWALKDAVEGRGVDRKQFVERFRARGKQHFIDSKEGRYRYNPKRYPGFVGDYYGESVDFDVQEELIGELVRQVDGMFDNPVFTRLLSVPHRIREIERLEQFTVGEIPVWVSLDVLVENQQGGLVVVDWKTGRSHTSAHVAAQLGIYGLYVRDRYLNGVESAAESLGVEALYANLRTGTHEVWKLDKGSLKAAREVISNSAQKMQEKLLSLAENTTQESEYPLLPEGSSECEKCVFRRTCNRE
jgi:hypothetical protein